MVKTCTSVSSIRTKFLFLKNTKFLIFGGISKFCL
jgi:hypothetical protein